MPADELRELVAKSAITDQIHRYCTAIDSGDAPLLESVFMADAIIKINPSDAHTQAFQFTSADFIKFSIPFLKACEVVFHQMGNICIEISGNRAQVQSNVIAFHRVPASLGNSNVVPSHQAGVDEDWIVGDRYDDLFVVVNGEWKIAVREATHLWERWESTNARSFPRPSILRS